MSGFWVFAAAVCSGLLANVLSHPLASLFDRWQDARRTRKSVNLTVVSIEQSAQADTFVKFLLTTIADSSKRIDIDSMSLETRYARPGRNGIKLGKTLINAGRLPDEWRQSGVYRVEAASQRESGAGISQIYDVWCGRTRPVESGLIAYRLVMQLSQRGRLKRSQSVASTWEFLVEPKRVRLGATELGETVSDDGPIEGEASSDADG